MILFNIDKAIGILINDVYLGEKKGVYLYIILIFLFVVGDPRANFKFICYNIYNRKRKRRENERIL